MSASHLSGVLEPLALAPHPTATLVDTIDFADLPSASFDGATGRDPRLVYFGGHPEEDVAMSGMYTRPTGADNHQSLYFTTQVTGAWFGVMVVHLTGSPDTDIAVYVDGAPVGARPHVISEPGYRIILVKGLTNAPHEVIVRVGPLAYFVQLIFATGASLAPAARPAFTLAVLGDSYGDLGVTPYLGGLPAALHQRTGWEIWQCGQGSTGYTNPGTTSHPTKSVYGSPARIAAVTAGNPDMILVLGSVNDGSASPAQVKDAAAALYAAHESTPMVVLGVEPLYDPNDPTLQNWNAINTAIREAAEAAPNVVGFIDWRAEDWLTGTGCVSDVKDDGNQDIFIGDLAGTDTIHPNYEGADYLAARIVDRLRTIVRPTPPTPWYTVDTQRAQDRLIAAWEDAPFENLETLGYLLSAARQQVAAYAGDLPATDDLNDRLAFAQLRQAINLWNAGRVSGDGDLGDGAYTFTPRPLDKTIRQIIRPINTAGPYVL